MNGTLEQMRKKAQNEGVRSKAQGIRRSACPYTDLEAMQRDAWRAGWDGVCEHGRLPDMCPECASLA